MADLLRPTDLAKIRSDVETAKTRDDKRRAKQQEEEQKSLHDAFMEREIHPEVKDRLNAAVRRAAEQGPMSFRCSPFRPATAMTAAAESTTANQIGQARSKVSRRGPTCSTTRN